MTALPPFPVDLVGLLCTVDDDGPAAIPVSALRRAADDRILFALAPHRGSLARLRREPRVALALLGEGFAVTARGQAHVIADPLPGAPFVVAVGLRVRSLDDALAPHTAVHAGITWSWREPDAAERHRQVLAALHAL